MKRKEINIALAAAIVCTITLVWPMTKSVGEGEDTSNFGQGVGGISLSINNYYKKTYSEMASSISLTDAFIIAKKQEMQEQKEDDTDSIYKDIGIVNVPNYLNIREKADESSNIVGILPKNGGCYIYSIDPLGWANVKSGEITGYVLSKYLVTGKEVATLAKEVGQRIATVSATTARMREEKSTDSPTIALIPKGEEVEVLDDSDEEWLYARVDDDKGYISRDLVDVKYQLAKAVESEEEASLSIPGNQYESSETRLAMVSYAKKFLGGKYVYGGTSLTDGIDCSAFMMRIYEHFGYNISRTSRSQAEEGTEIKLSEVRPGDLVFYDRDGTIRHVAMYIGNGKIIHASNPTSGIKISNMYYKMPFKAARFLDD